MSDAMLAEKRMLGFRAGDWIEVRSRDEIMSTLDEQGCLDALPFMPEMLQYCGKRFKVYKSAHKTCDTIEDWMTMRGMTNAVHLEGLRCDGQAHGGCQAGCLLYWKFAWLKSVSGSELADDHPEMPLQTHGDARLAATSCDIDALARATHVPVLEGQDSEEIFRCQATELVRATVPLKKWSPQQYVTDITSGNVRLGDFFRYAINAVFNVVMRLPTRLIASPLLNKLVKRIEPLVTDLTKGRDLQPATNISGVTTPHGCLKPRQSSMIFTTGEPPRFNFLRYLITTAWRRAKRLNRYLCSYPYIPGLAGNKTPTEVLNLQPGELVQVRSKDEIMRTINAERRNRGLSFDVEMVPYCGRTFRVLRRVDKIINEKTGRMMRLPNDCIVLEGVTCSGCLSRNRLFCPRSIYSYWREIWLRRVDESESTSGAHTPRLMASQALDS